ncbi:MAG: carbohydrate ABC transporter permease [Clostridiales bacterium]|jgi:putative aldouronate transport system permease protein|nr:carbohydrate ABC transporter permease [Clostridiales bacterium]
MEGFGSRKLSVSFRIFNFFNICFMVFVCVLVMFPYLNVLAIALNDNAHTVHSGMMLIPVSPTLANFQTLLADSGIWHAAMITLLRLLIAVPLTIFINFTGSYALSKHYLPGRKQMIFLLMVPSYISAGLIPTYILYAQLGLLNSFWVYVLPVGFWFFGFILLRTYMYTIPDSLEESAKLDGANDLVVMVRIYLPLCLPIIATLVLFAAVSHWNDWTSTLYFVTNYSKLSTLVFELQRVLREQDRIARLIQEAIVKGVMPPSASSGTSEGLRNAQIIVTTLPIILVYPFLQKYFVQGMLVGSIKE